MTEKDLQNAFQEIADALLGASRADDEIGELAECLDGIIRIATFEEMDILTTDAGLVVTTEKGPEFHITIKRIR